MEWLNAPVVEVQIGFQDSCFLNAYNAYNEVLEVCMLIDLHGTP